MEKKTTKTSASLQVILTNSCNFAVPMGGAMCGVLFICFLMFSQRLSYCYGQDCFKIKNIFIYLFLVVLDFHCCVGFSVSSCSEQSLLSSIVLRLLIVVVSLVGLP